MPQIYSDTNGNSWDVEKLIKLAKVLPVQRIATRQLHRWLDEAVWEDRSLTIREVVSHYVRIRGADLNCPLILDADGNLMDGAHRLAKAYIEGVVYLPVVQFEVTPPPDFKAASNLDTAASKASI